MAFYGPREADVIPQTPFRFTKRRVSSFINHYKRKETTERQIQDTENSTHLSSLSLLSSKLPEMEKPKEQKRDKSEEEAKSRIWDCDSSLYDSFELKSFKRQLDSAIVSSSRTLSMPHLSDRRPPPPPQVAPSKKPSKFSRSFNKLLRSVFRLKPHPTSLFRVQEPFFFYDKSDALSTIPEASEIDYAGVSPDVNSLVKRSTSDRFSASSVGISCA
ncbi:uncharacterized protein LOC117934459 [Vitis riparia]|uniref:uncharacterized protein LOC117934459 n=1 Tax=Vitis riparia TaxID=96939 RepID=UPI00155AC5A0|nr:uncharacterized protein LOC117934459 [Vitis riparia]